jgi:hypothetical protein
LAPDWVPDLHYGEALYVLSKLFSAIQHSQKVSLLLFQTREKISISHLFHPRVKTEHMYDYLSKVSFM